MAAREKPPPVYRMRKEQIYPIRAYWRGEDGQGRRVLALCDLHAVKLGDTLTEGKKISGGRAPCLICYGRAHKQAAGVRVQYPSDIQQMLNLIRFPEDDQADEDARKTRERERWRERQVAQQGRSWWQRMGGRLRL